MSCSVNTVVPKLGLPVDIPTFVRTGGIIHREQNMNVPAAIRGVNYFPACTIREIIRETIDKPSPARVNSSCLFNY